MSIVFDDILYSAVHDVLAVTATLTPSGGDPVEIEVIDKTAGVEVQGPGSLGMPTVEPAAVVRSVVLADAGLTRSDLPRATLVLNGVTYRVKSSRPRPSPGGEADGEVMMYLAEQ